MPRTTRGFTLLEVLISGVLLALLMLAVMGVLSQAQRDMNQQAAQTDVTEKVRTTMEKISQELRESGIHQMVCGYRGSGASGGITRTEISFPAEPDMSQCPDQFCPWHFAPATSAEMEPHAYLCRHVEMQADATAFSTATPANWLDATNTTTTGRVWVGITAGTQCPAGHTYTSTLASTVQMGACMFASPRNREGRFVSQEGSDRGTDWQALVFLVPFARGANVVELRRYVVYVDDLVHDDGLTAWTDATGQGVVAPPTSETLTTTAGAGASNGAFGTNVPAGKPTVLDLLDFDGDGAIGDGVFDLAGGAADATTESFDVITVSGVSFIQYVKRGNAGGGSYDVSITINRDTGDTTFAVNNTYGSLASSPGYQKTVTIQGRSPQTVATNLRDIEFADIRNCPFDATANPTGLVAPQDVNVVRVTAFFDKLLGTELGGGTAVRRATSQEVVVTRVQPRN